MIKNCIDYFLIFFLLASVNLYAQVAGTPPVYNCLTDLWVKQLRGSNDPVCTQINFSNLSGVLSDTQCPDASASVEGCVTIGTQTFAGEKTIQDPFHFLSYYELGEIAEPATPSANNLRIFAVDQNGFETLQVKTSDGVVGKIMEDGFQKVKNDTLSVITEDTVVYRSGATGNVSQVAPAKADSAVTMPAFGVVVNDIAVDGFGKVQTFGAYSKFNTLAWDEGDRLFVSAATAGAVTNVAPVHPNLQQRIGSVIKKAGGNGGIIDVSPLSQRGDEDGTNQSSFTIGATEAASMILSPSSTAQRTFIYPDLSGDVCVYQAGDKTWGSGDPFTWTFDSHATDKPSIRFDNGELFFEKAWLDLRYPGLYPVINMYAAGGVAPFFNMRWSRGTLAVPEAVETGDLFGTLNWFGHDGTNYQDAGYIWVEAKSNAVSGKAIPSFMGFRLGDGISTPALDIMKLNHDGSLLASPLELDATDPADSGSLRLDNADCISWESSPAGADNCLTVNASEELVYNGTPFTPFNPTNYGTTTWGSGSPFVWTFDAGTVDPVMRFKNEAIVIGDDVAIPFPGYSRLIVAKNGGVDLEVMSAGSDGAFVDLMRSGGTLAEPTVSTGGILGGYNFFGYDGDSYEFGAAIEVLQTGDAGANFIPTDMRFGVRDTAGVFHYLLFDNSGDLEIPGEFRPGGGIVTEELINVLSAGGQVGFYSRGGNNEGGRLALVSHGNTDAYSPTTSSSTAYLGEILFRGYNTTPVIVTGARIESNITGTVGTFIPSNLRFFTSSSSSINLAMTINSAQDILAAVSYTSPIFKSTSADPADSGIFRLGNAEEICWESSPAGADNCLTVNTSEELNYNGSPVGGGGDNITVNTTEATDANFLDNIYIAYAINTASNPDDITSKFVYNAASGDHGLLANESAFAANGFVFEGATANTIETYLQVTDPTVSDKTVTFPNANSNTVIPDTGAANNFLTAISSGGVISKAQPAFSNLSGSATDGQLPSSMAGKTFTGTTVISERFDLSGDISPAQITATTNDYNPSGLSTASVLRLTTDATRHITGIVGGADGRELEIRNVGSNLIVFLNENVGSTAANRFAFIGDTGYAVMLNPNESVTFRYDSTSSRWRNVTKIITSACEISVEYPSGTDELEFCELPSAVYVSSIRCECYGTCTVVPSIKVCKGEDLGDDTCTTNILSSTESITMSCSTAGALDNSLNLPELTANQGVSLVITNNPSANVNSLRVVVEYSQ